MSKKLLLLVFCCFPFLLMGQKLTVESFDELVNNITARTNSEVDNNGKPCALVIVQVASSEAEFDDNMVVKVIPKTSEYWVYMPEGSKRLKMTIPDYLPLEVTFADINPQIQSLSSKTTYRMVVTGINLNPTTKREKKAEYVVISTKPSGAKLTLIGQEKYEGMTPFEKLLAKGRYNYRLEHRLYHPLEGTFVLGNSKVVIDTALKPAFGSVRINIKDGLTNVKVELDGKELEQNAPCTLKEVPSGNHTIKLNADMYEVEEVSNFEVRDEETTTLNISMRPRFAVINITSFVQGAKIFVDNNYKGTTECKLQLEEGYHNVRVTKEHYIDDEQEIFVVREKSQNIVMTPKAILCELDISSKPSNASVKIDGVSVGNTPLYIDTLLEGPHKAKVSLNGYSDTTFSFNLKKDITEKITISLQNDNHRVKEQEKQQTLTSSVETFTVKGVEFKMIKVEGGTFSMGATSEQGSDAHSDEKPVHSVTLLDYYIGETEVTQELWQAVMGSNPSYFKGNNQRPVEYVSWDDCQEFIEKLNYMTGKNFRLPTEAEWEYAARGGKHSKNYVYKYSGSNNVDEVAWYYSNSGNTTHTVKTKKANKLGLYDMSGNVCEWCNDWYRDYQSYSQTNPTGPSTGVNRVLRGGSWNYSDRSVRVSYRGIYAPGNRFSRIGLRLALGTSQIQIKEQEEQNVTPKPIGQSETFTVKGVEFKMIRVEGGTFSMGATSEQTDYDDDEKPVHSVTLSDYYIGETEVTQELWKAVMGSNPSYFTGNNQRPVENVSWDDCQEFIEKLNQLTGKRFRLPTEAEWEYAARGGKYCKDYVYKYSGSNNVDEVAWYDGNSGGTTHPVKTKKANKLGLYDMSGNVWEWCSDWFGDYQSYSQTNTIGPSTGEYRVLRGGSWSYFDRFVRVSYRHNCTPGYRNDYNGLRLAL